MNRQTILVKNLVIFFIFCISHSAYAQENYLPGSVLLHNGDTLNGFVDYRNWERNPDKVFFKKGENDNRTGYGPMDIAGFDVSDELYRSAIVQVEITPNNVRKMDYYSDLRFQTDTAFLQTMIEGEKSLYLNEYKYGRDQFYIRTDSGYALLIYKEYLKKNEKNRELAENNKYKGQLAYYLKEAPEIQSALQNTKYTKKSLEKIFELYYDRIEQDPEFSRTVDKAVIEVGAIGGFSSTTLKFTAAEHDSYKYLVEGEDKASQNFTAGVFLNVVIPRHQGKWSVNNEIIYTSYEIHGNYEDRNSENDFHNYAFTFNYSYLKANNMIRYKYPTGNFFWFINAGVSNAIVISGENFTKHEDKFYSTHEIFQKPAIKHTRKHEFGYLGGAGLAFKRLSLELRYERANAMSNYLILKAHTNRYYLLLGYRF